MASNSLPVRGESITEAEGKQKAPGSRLKNAVAGAALGVSLALGGSPAEAAGPAARMDEVRNTCVAETRVKKESLLKLVETKRAAGEMDKVAKLE